ncbi:uncharacterized protein LOC110734054 [Chenopodium quinoa]|uniref:uncharacterized protein LOC110734054 n=1 Tax=Chenopodium quinoa TaxID=63459 RepID=UPI000B789564|nr:uncharacterized protein LOC110734054 [Chenopodium quinoa]XP_021769809.1 uncharacterized protein LOC110734054 [Chenopodium quinoa]
MSSYNQMTGSNQVDDPEANTTTIQPAYPPPKKCSSSIFILCFVLILILLPLIYSCFLIIALATLPLLLISLLIIRIFQFFKYGKSYKKLTYFKNFIRGWLYINVMMVLLGLWIFFPIAKYVPSLKIVLVLDLPFTKWVEIISIVCGFYLISYLIYSLTHGLTPMLNVRSLNFPQAFSEITDGIIIWRAEHEVMKRVPAFKQHKMLGLPIRRWIRVSILVLIGYNLITLFTYIAVLSLRKICQQRPKVAESGFWYKLVGKHLHKKYVVYFANGMRLSINFIMSSLLLLGTWVTYLGSRLDMNSTEAKHIWEFGEWTLLSLFICSFLWSIKTFVLLAWEIHTVYHRLEHRIIPISEQLYFLGILGCHRYDILKLLPKSSAHQQTANSPPPREYCIFQSISICLYPLQNLTRRFASISKEFRETLNIRKWERITNHLLVPKNPTMDDLQRAIKHFKVAKKLLLKETYISDILTAYDPEADYWENLNKVMVDHHKELNSQGKWFMELFNLNSTPREENGEGVPNSYINQENSSQICFNDDQKTWVVV